jgi:peptide/nickel transport system permease protein
MAILYPFAVGKFVLKRIGLALVTLFIVTTAIFFMTHILPGNAAERILGPFAERENVLALEKELGLDKPMYVQYWKWLSEALSGQLGDSVQYQSPVSELLLPAIGYSFRLAAMAFLIVVPLSIFGGIIAAINRGKAVDRVITVGGLSAAVIPEFVWAVLLVFVVGVKLEWLPVTAFPDDDTSIVQVIRHMLLPSIALVLVLFGYISRIARAGVIEAMDSDYSRTAVLKGLSKRQMINRHVLRNALLPTIAVIASQVPYLVGGLVAVEIVFNYPGFGSLLLQAVQYRDYPMLQAAVLIVTMQLIADILFALLNPRIRQTIAE